MDTFSQNKAYWINSYLQNKADKINLVWKVLFSLQMVLPVAVEDVKREVKILKALQGHENVVHFYNAFEDDNFVYIVME